MDSLSNWSWWIIAGGILLSPVFAFLLAILAETKDLVFDHGGYLVYEPTGRRIDVIYERVDEDMLYADLPELIDCHVEGRVHVLFAPNRT